MTWPTTPDGQWYQFEGDIKIPVNPETGVAILNLRPQGGMGVGVPAIAQGDPGVPANLDTTVNHTSLAYDDPTAESASITVLTPPTTTTPGVYRLNLATRRGEPGLDGANTWDPADLDPSPAAGRVPVVNSALDGFDLVDQKIPEVFYPGTISNTASGNPNSTLCPINIPARPYARRVLGQGFTVVTGEAADVRVNLLARLNSESAGNIVGKCIGIAQTERLTMAPGKPIEAGTVADGYDTIAANTAATLYIRCERQAGTSTYTTSAVTSQFCALVLPL